MKVSELTDAALDWAVAKCEGHDMEYFQVLDAYLPSTDWAEGGPIIERERIRLDCPWDDQWDATHPDGRHQAKKDGWTGWISGPTPLIAAMRCYVASKLGDDIEIPEELL